MLLLGLTAVAIIGVAVAYVALLNAGLPAGDDEPPSVTASPASESVVVADLVVWLAGAIGGRRGTAWP